MALTPSTMLPLGTPAPNFNLPDSISGKMLTLNELKSDHGTVIMFICNHCPYVKHIQTQMVNIANQYQKKGFRFVAINSNDVESYPDDSPENMLKEAKAHHYSFPYLFDETQAVAKLYQAACTPDLYLFDNKLRCVYRGRFDDSTPGNTIPVTGKDLVAAMDALLENSEIHLDQKPSVGCNIKWKK